MINNYDYDSKYYLDDNHLNNDNYIEARIKASGLVGKVPIRTFENLLRYLYITNYSKNVNRSTIRKYISHFSEAEKIMLFRLETRSSGSERFNYGLPSVAAIKRDKYQCVLCGQKDVRCLEIDHINGRTHKKGDKNQVYTVDCFQTLCSNHHRIKTIVEQQQN